MNPRSRHEVRDSLRNTSNLPDFVAATGCYSSPNDQDKSSEA